MLGAAESVTGIPREKWSEKLGRGDSDDTLAMEKKLGQRKEQWPSDYAEYQSSGMTAVTADSTLVTADVISITADMSGV